MPGRRKVEVSSAFSPELRDLDIGVADAAERGEAGEPAPPRRDRRRRGRGGVRGVGRAPLPSQNRTMNCALALAGWWLAGWWPGAR